MKIFKLITLIFLFLIFNYSEAQVSVNVNIGKRPVWGPVVTTEEYYYLPDINSYYDIQQSQFIYINNGVWIRNSSLPVRYKAYDLKTGYVVVLNDYHGRSPYKNFKNHNVKYYKNNNNWYKSRERYNNNRGYAKAKGNKKEKHK